MPCFLIDPTQKTITAAEGGGDLTDVRALIGFETVDSDEIDANGDRLYFDEKCFIRQTPGVGRFQLDSLAPVAGMGVVVGSGAQSALQTPQVSLEALKKRVKFL
jgi:hypothetical protein